MNFLPYLEEALANLLSSKLRSILAMLGILVGTASVVALVSSGELATKQALLQFKGLGTDLMSVSVYAKTQSNSSPKLTLKKAEGILDASKNINKIAPYTSAYETMSYNGQQINGNIIGVTESIKDILKINIKQGRFISFLDTYEPFCVIGQSIAQQMRQHGALDPIGQQINLGNHLFTVIGVADQWPQSGFFNEDVNQAVLIPIRSTAVLSKYAQINNIIMQLKPNTDINTVEGKIKSYINKALPQSNLFFRSAQQLISSMQKQHQIFTILLGVIGSISLLVGGIGVMNIMLVSVMERRREIGIRLAIGAKRKDIRMLFLAESIAITLFGGLMGILLGILTSYVIAVFRHWQFEFFPLPTALGFSVSVAIGIFFGFYPAHRASKLDPIETLRAE